MAKRVLKWPKYAEQRHLCPVRASTEDKLYGGINNLRLTASLFLGFFFYRYSDIHVAQ